MTDKLVNGPMVQQRVLNEVNIHRDKGLRHPSIVRVCMLFSEWEFTVTGLEVRNSVSTVPWFSWLLQKKMIETDTFLFIFT